MQQNLNAMETNAMKFFCTQQFFDEISEDPTLDQYLQAFVPKPKNYSPDDPRSTANFEGTLKNKKNVFLVFKALKYIYEPEKHIHIEVLKTFSTFGCM